MKRRQTSQTLTEGPLLRQILFFTFPLIATAVLQLLFNTADTVVVGRWGGDTPEECANSLAAVGSCAALITLIVNLFFGLSVGSGICVAQGIGAGQKEDVEKYVHTSVLASTIAGAIVTVIGLVFSRTFLSWMGTDDTILDEATLYMTAYFCGMPANMLYNYCASMLRSSGDTVHPLIYLSAAGVVNVILNLVTVLVFRWGALGVGVATAVSQWISCILTVWFMMRTDGPCHLDLHRLRIDGKKLKRVVLLGIPAGIQSTLFSISNVLNQAAVNSFGPTIVAGNTAASNLDNYVYATQNALYHTTLTFVGQNAGAMKYHRMKKSILYCVAVVAAVGLLVGGAVLVFGEPLLHIFAPENEDVVQAGLVRLSIVCLPYFLCGWMEVGCGALRGLGKSLTPMIVSLIGACLLRVVWIYTVFAAVGTPESLYVAWSVSWGATAAVQFLFVFLTLRKLKKRQDICPEGQTIS